MNDSFHSRYVWLCIFLIINFLNILNKDGISKIDWPIHYRTSNRGLKSIGIKNIFKKLNKNLIFFSY